MGKESVSVAIRFLLPEEKVHLSLSKSGPSLVSLPSYRLQGSSNAHCSL